MILLTPEDSDYIHRVAVQHVKLLQSDALMRSQGTQMEIALYEEMIAHRLCYVGDWIGIMTDTNQHNEGLRVGSLRTGKCASDH
ncbi:hypothetical protein [Staphylococcus ursi]|uniref:hypothetical protein n=1 Tax=Staphylococcus sp. MI 10-1553 TaxID=1912064 RepID=UPI001EF0E217|nr:hypothetical protein [Staphylococcus sp. MI 10-1553]